jgi:Zn-dependent protease with chaperone function
MTTSTGSKRQAILAQIDFKLQPQPMSLGFRIGITAAGIVMLLLPLLYVGLIVGVGYFVYWHAVENAPGLGAGRVRGAIWLYLGPLFVGVTLVFFMIKPFFAPRARRGEEFELDPRQQPFLFEFVERLCGAVGAPAPKRILVDTNANASAGFHGGGTGLFTAGRELTLGLALVATMPLREFAGVLAHEFGHFNQGTSMRMSAVVMSVNAWLARVAYERDAWDERLRTMQKSGTLGLIVTSWLARFCVWLTRLVLIGLVRVAHFVTSYLSRQMEYDADRVAIAFAGSEASARGLRRVTCISVAEHQAHEALSRTWEERRLAADVPGWIARHYVSLPRDVKAKVLASLDEEPKLAFATHPRIVERVAAAQVIGDPGRFDAAAPASELFDGFEDLCVEASRRHYRAVLGEDFDESCLVDNAVLFDETRGQLGEEEALARVWGGQFSTMRALRLPSLPLAVGTANENERSGAGPDESTYAAVRDEAAARVAADYEATVALYGDYVQAYDRLAELRFARAVMRFGKIDAKSFGLPEAKPNAARREIESVKARAQTFAADLDDRLDLVARRVAAGLSIWFVRRDAGAEDAVAAVAEIERFVRLVAAMAVPIEELVEVRATLSSMFRLAQTAGDDIERAEVAREMAKFDDALAASFTRIGESLGELAYPFEHRDGAILLRTHASCDAVLAAKDPNTRFQAAVEADRRLTSVYVRCLGRLALLVEKAGVRVEHTAASA